MHHRANELSPEDKAEPTMQRRMGDTFTFVYDGRELVGSVHRCWGPLAIIQASDGELYREDIRKETYYQLQDRDRCTHCGGFICDKSCPTANQQNQKYMSEEKQLTLAQVLEIEPGTKEQASWINGAFEAVVTNVREPRGNGPFSAILTTAEEGGVKIVANFWKVDPRKLQGKLVRFSGQAMRRTEYVNQQSGKTTQQVDIGEKATIEVIGVSAAPDKPLPHQGSPHRDTPLNAPAATGTQAEAGLTDTLRRAKCYFGVLFDVEAAYDGAKGAGLKVELTPADLKDIATHISMTYRGQYGAYQEPTFPARKKASDTTEAALAALPEHEWSGDGAAPVILKDVEKPKPPKPEQPLRDQKPALREPAKPPGDSSWSTFIHPKRKVALGDMTEADQLGLVRWALTTGFDKVPPTAKTFYANVMLMAAAKRWETVPKAMLASVEASGLHDQQHWDDACIGKFGVAMEMLDPDQLTEALKDFAELEAFVREAKERGPEGEAGDAAIPS